MDSTGKITLYALDCGAVNWRLYRMEYHFEEGDAKHVTSPLSSPLSSFKDRKLPAVLTLNEDGSDAEAIGEQALAHIEDHSIRNRVRDFFKPSIGNPASSKTIYTFPGSALFPFAFEDFDPANSTRKIYQPTL